MRNLIPLHQPKAPASALHLSGSELFAPHANNQEATPWRNVISAEGVKQIATPTAQSVYGTFGTNVANSTVEVTLTHLNEDLGGISHSGLGLWWVNFENCAVIAMINIKTGHFEVVDKIGATETIHYDHAVPGGLAYDTRYKIKIALSGTTAVCELFSVLGVLLDTYTLTLQAGAPATGYPVVHIYGCKAVFHSVRSWNSSGADLVNSNMAFASVQVEEHRSGLLVSNGQLDFYSDGTHSSTNAWMNILTNLNLQNFYMKGKFIYKSGRACGISFRSNGEGEGYQLFYDNTAAGVVKLYKGKITTLVTSWADQGLMVADTEYPWTLKVSGSSITWVINGHTYTYTDVSYPSAGYVGLLGYQSHYLLKDWVTLLR